MHQQTYQENLQHQCQAKSSYHELGGRLTFPLTFQIVGEILKEKIPLLFTLALPLAYAFYELQG